MPLRNLWRLLKSESLSNCLNKALQSTLDITPERNRYIVEDVEKLLGAHESNERRLWCAPPTTQRCTATRTIRPTGMRGKRCPAEYRKSMQTWMIMRKMVFSSSAQFKNKQLATRDEISGAAWSNTGLGDYIRVNNYAKDRWPLPRVTCSVVHLHASELIWINTFLRLS